MLLSQLFLHKIKYFSRYECKKTIEFCIKILIHEFILYLKKQDRVQNGCQTQISQKDDIEYNVQVVFYDNILYISYHMCIYFTV